MATTGSVKIWERLPCDNEESWPAFVAYRDQPPPRRLLRFAGVPTGKLYEYYRDHDWKSRVEAYDNHLDSIRLAEREALILRNEREVMGDRLKLLADANELVARELEKLVVASRASDMPGIIRPSELNRLIDITMRYDRLIRGESTENVKVDAGVDLSKLSAEELRVLDQLTSKAKTG